MRITDQEFHQLLVLKTLRRFGPIARTDLARRTGLAGGTITKIINGLVAGNVVTEERGASRQRGRPRVYLSINPEGGYVVGAWLAPAGKLAFEIVNLRGDCVYSVTLQLPPSDTLEVLAREIAAAINRAIGESPAPRSGICRVGVTLPAMIDAVHGRVLLMVTYPESKAPFAEILQRHLKLPVVIDNTGNVMARGEHWFGSGDGLDDFSLVILDLGVSSGHYANGSLQIGSTGVNPEFGHVKVVMEEGERCSCGARGCLSIHSGMYGIVRQIAGARGKRRVTLSSLSKVNRLFHEYAREARAGDTLAREAFDRAGRLLGIAVANHINGSDPGRVLVVASEPLFLDTIEAPFYRALDLNTLAPLRQRTAVEFRSVDDSLVWQGAAALGLEEFYRLSGSNT